MAALIPGPAPAHHVITPLIYQLRDWIEEQGVVVDLYAMDLPDDVGGRYDNDLDPPMILLNETIAKRALMTLAHEVGHWVGYRVMRPRATSSARERQAFGYGWKALGLVGAQHGDVTREDWIAFEHERREAVKIGVEKAMDTLLTAAADGTIRTQFDRKTGRLKITVGVTQTTPSSGITIRTEA
jgi:hypothetical protein